MLSRPPTDNKGEQDNNDLILLPEEMFIRLQTDVMPEQEYYDLEQEVARAQQCQNKEMEGWRNVHHLDLSQDGCAQDPQWFRGHQIVVPSEEDLRRRIMDYYHDTPTAGHCEERLVLC